MIDIFDLISKVESDNDIHAIRFEPGKYATLINGPMLPNHAEIVYRIQHIHKCSLGTAQAIYCTSYGAVQIMGFNLYGEKIQCAREFVDYLNSSELQRSTFITFLQSVDLDHYSLDELLSDRNARINFAIKYNGAIDYSNRMEICAKALGLTIK